VTAALAEIDAERPDALLLTSGLPYDARSTVMQFVVTKRLPTIADLEWLSTFEPFPLLSYGPVLPELMRSAAEYIHKILKGSKAGDLPIQQPVKFEMVVNLKTAKAICLTVPQQLLINADKVME
jgi:putative tryptophan/tyrosine transport system substrate-binding protein